MGEYVEDERAFNFREFFRTKDDDSFIHEKDVDRFLNLLCKEDKDSLYPYSNETFRRIFRHTLWLVPGVKAARALSAKLKAHPVFGMFQTSVGILVFSFKIGQNLRILTLVKPIVIVYSGMTMRRHLMGMDGGFRWGQKIIHRLFLHQNVRVKPKVGRIGN